MESTDICDKQIGTHHGIWGERDKEKSQVCPKLFKVVGANPKKGRDFLILMVKRSPLTLPHLLYHHLTKSCCHAVH